MSAFTIDDPRLVRGAVHLHNLGARAMAEFLCTIGEQTGGMHAILALLFEYECRLTPSMLRAVGGDRFPRRPLHIVPPEASS